MKPLLALSEAIADYRRRAFGNIAASAKLKKVKAANPKLGSFVDARRTKIAADRVLAAIRVGQLRVYLSPCARERKEFAAANAHSPTTAGVLAHPLPLSVFELLPCRRDVPMDRPGDLVWRSKPLLAAAANADRHLPARLSLGILALSGPEYSRWVRQDKRRRPMPSQKRSRGRPEPRRGRPRLALDDFILGAVRSGAWSRNEAVARLRALYAAANPSLPTPSENTLRTRIRELAIEHDDEGLQPRKRAGFSKIRKRDVTAKLP